jgi:hypothetical protein
MGNMLNKEQQEWIDSMNKVSEKIIENEYKNSLNYHEDLADKINEALRS